jgi:hypothetical protein
MARLDPFKAMWKRDRQVRADDHPAANPVTGNRGKCVGHERRRLPDRNDVQWGVVQPLGNCPIVDGLPDQMCRRRRFNRAMCDRVKLLAKTRQREMLSGRSWDRTSPTIPSPH